MEKKLEELNFTLKSLREKVMEWKIADERREFLRQLYPFIRDGEERYPDLGDVLTPEEIECLLFDCATWKDCCNEAANKFVEFVTVSGYMLKPDVDVDGEPILRRSTPVHEAAKNGSVPRCKMINYLCQIYGYVNYIGEDGYTHFHAACQYNDDELHAVEMFLKLRRMDPNNCLLPKTGDSPLHLALMERPHQLAPLKLLLYGADPNVANARGLTPLHCICNSGPVDEWFLVLFFEIAARLSNRPVKVDVADDSGRTPLHLALANGDMSTTAFLLRHGANPNRANEAGETALHAVCKYPRQLIIMTSDYSEFDSTQALFEHSHERYWPLRVDARDNEGRTPLQWAVANHTPDALQVLLDHGADLAGFVYPAANHCDDEEDCERMIDVKSRQLLGALLCAERLAERGYELTRGDALQIMRLFARHGFFEGADVDLRSSLLENEAFASRARKLTVNKDVLLHDVIQLRRAEEVNKRVTYEDMFDFVNNDVSRFEFDKVGAEEACPLYLCEIMSRRFFQSWALEPFWKMIRYRLPLEMCEIILGNLKNEDLYKICLADQVQEDSKKDATASVTKCDSNKRPRESEDQEAPKKAKIYYEEH
uniref:Ankyrin repeat protein n=2 Tax=Trichogramma kaykai TaxID=54128 RepID=A0ABD2WJ88_9HYME